MDISCIIPDFETFKKEVGTSNITEDSNLFEIIHLSENDHTNILCSILNYKEQGTPIFLGSFLSDVLNYPANLVPECALKTQVSAQKADKINKNPENKGIIDLLINNGDDVIIVESKACDAPDGDCQLQRYFETYEEKFGREHIWIAYLTRDGSQEPDPKSLGKLDNKVYSEWRESHLVYVNYADDILPWLKDAVLPNIRYLDSGTLIQGLSLYIKYLEGPYLSTGNDKDSLFSKKSLEALFEPCEVPDLYDALIEGYRMRENETFRNDPAFPVYLSCLRFFVNKKINGAFANSQPLRDWRFNFTAGFIQIMKIGWYEANSGIHFELSGYGNKKPRYDWSLHFESRPKYQEYCGIQDKIKEGLEEATGTEVSIKPTPSHCYLFFNDLICFSDGLETSKKKSILRNDTSRIVSYFEKFVGDKRAQDVNEIVEKVISNQIQ